MEKWIILIAQEPNEELYQPPFYLSDVEDLAVCDDDGNLMWFNSLEEANNYQEENTISGQCVQVPML